jgi:hypothetical protein
LKACDARAEPGEISRKHSRVEPLNQCGRLYARPRSADGQIGCTLPSMAVSRVIQHRFSWHVEAETPEPNAMILLIPVPAAN